MDPGPQDPYPRDRDLVFGIRVTVKCTCLTCTHILITFDGNIKQLTCHEDVAVRICGVPPSNPVDGALPFRITQRPEMNCYMPRHFLGEDEAPLLSGAVGSEKRYQVSITIFSHSFFGLRSFN